MPLIRATVLVPEYSHNHYCSQELHLTWLAFAASYNKMSNGGMENKSDCDRYYGDGKRRFVLTLR
jgi:hypothetical protein